MINAEYVVRLQAEQKQAHLASIAATAAYHTAMLIWSTVPMNDPQAEAQAWRDYDESVNEQQRACNNLYQAQQRLRMYINEIKPRY